MLTWGIGSVVKNSARITKILKWFPSLDRKKLVPDNVDKYADDIRKANRDRDLKADKKDTDHDANKDKDNNSESEENKAEDAKALIAAKAFVEAQDALEPSPDVEVVVSEINRIPTTKLTGGKKYKAKPNGLGDGHFEIYYNPTVKKDYSEGDKENAKSKSGIIDVNKTRELSKTVSSNYKKWGKCNLFADSLKSKMKQNNLSGEHLRIDSIAPFMPSKSYELHGGNISEMGFHEAIRVDDTIFDNLHPEGVSFEWWLADLEITDLTNQRVYKYNTKVW